jgi:hypothetical protein
VQQQVCARVLRWFARAARLDPADARDMAGWDHGGGFSLDDSLRIEATTALASNGCCAGARPPPPRSRLRHHGVTRRPASRTAAFGKNRISLE